MDRSIFYPGSIPRSLDMNLVGKQAMVALGELMLDLFGASTICTGLACTATSPASLAVKVAAGRIYSLQNIDNSPISTGLGQLAADTTHQIVKQGILLDPVTLNCPAPVTGGQSINYLIQASYQDSDTNLIVLPYYNVNNPQQSLSGQGGLGGAQATTRAGVLNVTVKAGVPATTGSQTTPSVDAGFTALYVVTVAQGQTTITAGNIGILPGAPFKANGGLIGAFAITWGGFSAPPSGTLVYYTKVGNQVTLSVPTGSGTSNSNVLTITGLPTFLQPFRQAIVTLPGAYDNGANVGPAIAAITNSNPLIAFYKDGSTPTWTTSGAKGLFITGSSLASFTYSTL